MNQNNAPAIHSSTSYLANKASNASFTDAAWITDLPDSKVLWVAVKAGTAASGTFSFKGALFNATVFPFDVTLPASMTVHKTASAGTVAVTSGNVVLTGFSGVLAFGFGNPPYQVRLDYTASSGGAAAGANGFQAAYFMRGV